MRKERFILNNGLGVQTTTLYLMAMDGTLDALGIHIEASITADTQAEPKAVYQHLEWMKSLGGPPMLIRTRGSLSEQLKNGLNATGQRSISIPAYTRPQTINAAFSEPEPDNLTLEHFDETEPKAAEVGMIRRQCTREFKLIVIWDTIRREILGLAPGQRIPKDTSIVNVVGISIDEAGRANRLMARASSSQTFRFPLIELQMSRGDCLKWLEGRVPHKVPRSACVFCPFHDDNEWADLQEFYPEDFEEACQVDESLRIPGNVCNRGLDAPMFLHESCKPLREVVFVRKPKTKPVQLLMGQFWRECQGVCGI